MSLRSTAPDIANLDIPVDRWSAPFWTATAERTIRLPRCGNCGRFRWPPGPFCPVCHLQAVDWVAAGAGLIYSFTIIHSAEGTLRIPALVEFPQAGGIRLLTAIVGATETEVGIGADVEPDWSPALNAMVPIFRLRNAGPCTDDRGRSPAAT